MNKINYAYIATSIIVVLILSSMTLQWTFDKDQTSLTRDGDLIARYKWHIEAERTYINKNTAYRTNIMCPRIVKNGGHETETRCYYADDSYEQLSRSIIKTKLNEIETDNGINVNRNTPFYKYGTSGSYAGKLNELSIFMNTDVPEEFPIQYITEWNPTDTRNYQLVWRIWKLKSLNLPVGEYHDCHYTFGNIVVDLTRECDNLDKVVVKDDETVWIYFNNSKGIQSLDVNLVDPDEITPRIMYPNTNESILESYFHPAYDFNNYSVENVTDIWFNINSTLNLTIENNFTDGIAIGNCLELQNIRDNLSGIYYLANDIDCSDSSNFNDGSGFLEMGTGWDDNNIKFDGNNHIIKNLDMSTQNSLFGSPSSGFELKNIGLEDSSFKKAPIAGDMLGGTIKNVHCNNITIASAGSGFINSIIGYRGVVTINDSYSTNIKFLNTGSYGGLAKQINPFKKGVEINRVYATSSDDSVQIQNGFFDRDDSGYNSLDSHVRDSYTTVNSINGWCEDEPDYDFLHFENCYWDISRSGASTYGPYATYNITGVNDNYEEEDYWFNESKPVYSSWNTTTWFIGEFFPTFKKNLLFLEDGLYNITLFANIDGTIKNDTSTNILVTSSAPKLTINSPLNNDKYNDKNISINATCSNPTSDIWYTIDSITSIYNNPIYYTFDDGINNIVFYTNDSVGRTDEKSITFDIDSTAPIINIVSPTPENNTIMNFAENFINATVEDSHFNSAILYWQQPTYNDRFNDSVTTGNLTYFGSDEFVKYLEIPATAIMKDSYLNISGKPLGDFDDEILISQNTIYDLTTDVYGNNWIGQSLSSRAEDHFPVSAKLLGYRSGYPGNITFSLEEVDEDGIPSGISIMNTTFNGNSLTANTDGEWFEIEFPYNEYVIYNHSNLSFIIRATSGDFSNKVILKYDSASVQGEDFIIISSNGGESWVTGTGADLAYQTYGTSLIYPTQSWLEVGTIGGNYDWSYINPLNTTVRVTNLENTLNNALNNGNCDCDGCSLSGAICTIPFTFHSGTYGKQIYSNISMEYSWGEAFTEYPMNCSGTSPNYVCNTTVFNSSFGLDYSFYIFASDTYGGGSFSETRLLLDDTDSPYYLNETENPETNSLYTGGNYTFNITVKEENLDYCNITWDGVNLNVSEYNQLFPYHYISFNRTSLIPDTYKYSLNCIDLIGNYNSTEYEYVVSKADSSIFIYLNLNENNKTINQNENVSLQATLNLGDNNDIYLYNNNILINSGISPITSIVNYTDAGIFNISAVYIEDANYKSDISTLWVTVKDTTNPEISAISPINNTITNINDQIFEVNITDNYGIKNATFYIYNGDTLIHSEIKDYFGVGNKSIFESFEYTLPSPNNYSWYVSTTDTESNINNTKNNTISLRYYPLGSVNYPLSGEYISRPNSNEFDVILNLTVTDKTPDLINVSFWDNSTNTKIINKNGTPCDYFNIVSGSNVICDWNKSFVDGEVNNWFVELSDGKVTANSTLWNFIINDVDINDLYIYPIDVDYVTINWYNFPGITRTNLTLYDSDLSIIDSIIYNGNGHQNYTFFDIEPNTEYTLEWRIGDDKTFGEANNMTFISGGWFIDYINWTGLREINFTSSKTSSKYVAKLELTDENFVYVDNESGLEKTSFVKMDYNNFSDLRIMNYYKTTPLKFNVESSTIPEFGCEQDQVIPNETSTDGDMDWVNDSHDNNWNTYMTCLSGVCNYEFNYTVPTETKESAQLKMKLSESLTQYVDIPNYCFYNDEIQLLDVMDREGESGELFCRNKFTNNWISLLELGDKLVYETQMTWEYPCNAEILVQTEMFNNTEQEQSLGTSENYSSRFFMYYNNNESINNESYFDYDGVASLWTIGEEEINIPVIPVIHDVEISDVEVIGVGLNSVNITWKTYDPSNNIITYSENEWFIDGNHSDWDNVTNNPNINIQGLDDKKIYYYRIESSSIANSSLVGYYTGSFVIGTLATTPSTEIINYTEDRANKTITICGNLTDLNGLSNAKLSFKYFNKTDMKFSETSQHSFSSIGSIICETIPVEYGEYYTYVINGEADSGYSGYSESYENEFLNIQELFIGDMEDDDENDRMRRELNATIEISTWRGYREGTWQEEDYVYIETNVSTDNLRVKMWTGKYENSSKLLGWTDYAMKNTSDFSYITINNLSTDSHAFEIWNDFGMVLNHTKPSMIHAAGEDRTDARVYLKFNGTITPMEYQIVYQRENIYNRSGGYHCLYPDGVNKLSFRNPLFKDCFGVVYWGHATRNYSGTGGIPYGTAYDRGMMDRGQVTDMSQLDSGRMDFEPIPTYDREFPFVMKNCHTFYVMYWDALITTAPEITLRNYYYHSWTPTLYRSGSSSSKLSPTTTSFVDLFHYNETYAEDTVYVADADQRPWRPIPNSTVNYPTGTYPEHDNECDGDFCFNDYGMDTYTGTTETYETGFPEFYRRNTDGQTDDVNITLWATKKSFDNYTIGGDDIYDIGIHGFTESDWPTTIASHYHQTFLVINLPDDDVLKVMDSDGDGLSDYDELYVYITNPKWNDTDEGGVDDWTEVMISHTNPNLWYDEEIDAPQFLNYNVTPENNTAYLFDTEYKFSVNITDDNLIESETYITFNGTNYSISKNTEGLFEFTIIGLNESTYEYEWDAKDIFLNSNSSGILYYTVAPSESYECEATLNPNINFEFWPETSISENVEPEFQSSLNWSINIYNSQDFPARGIIRVLEEYDESWGGDIQIKAGSIYDYSRAIDITEDFKIISDTAEIIMPNESMDIWFWADYDVPLREWAPSLEVMVQKIN